MEFISDKNLEIIIHTFFMSVETHIEKRLDLFDIAQKFPLDVILKNNVLYHVETNKEIGFSTKICTTRTKNKILGCHSNIPYGFNSIQLPKSTLLLRYSYPPEFIPIGAYCISCGKLGPEHHTFFCELPTKNSLFFTLEGFIQNIFNFKNDCLETEAINAYLEILENLSNIKYSDTDSIMSARSVKTSLRTIDEDNISMASSAKKYKEYKVKNPEFYKESYKMFYMKYPKYFEVIFPDKFENLINVNPENVLKIKTILKLSNIYSLYKKEIKGYFNGPLLFTFTNGLGKSCTIRLSDNGNISFISNPWDSQNLYLMFIERLNKCCNKIIVKNTDIKSLFASFSILNCDIINNGQYDIKHIDLLKFYKYLWPRNGESPRIISEGLSFISSGEGVWYRYTVKMDKPTDKKMYINFISCDPVRGIESTGPYKISVQLFSQGHVQFNFCYCEEKDNVNVLIKNQDSNPTYNYVSIEDKLELVVGIVNDVKKLLIHYMNIFVKNDPTIILDAPIKHISDKIYPTIPGILPYAKRKKFVVGDCVNIFNDQCFKWTKSEAVVVDVLPGKKKCDNEYIVKYKNNNIIYRHKHLRRSDPNNDQVCRLKENGISKIPVPYSFYGNCSGGLTQFINPLGVCSRSDNRFYPSCNEINDEWILNFLLYGPTPQELDMHNINTHEIMENGYDKYSGTLDSSVVNIGSTALVFLHGIDGYRYVKILDKYKTHGLGNDENKVYYKVIDSESDQLYDIIGTDFHPKYIESRYFCGVLNSGLPIDIIKALIIECFKSMGLIYNSDPFGLGTENRYKKILKNFSPKIYEIDLLNNKNITGLQREKFSCFFCPRSSIRSWLILHNDFLYLTDNTSVYLLCNSPIVSNVFKDFYLGENGISYLIIEGQYDNFSFYSMKILDNKLGIDLNKIVEILQDVNTVVELYNPSIYGTSIDKISFIKNNFDSDFDIYFYGETMIFKWTENIRKMICVQAIKEYNKNWTVGLIKDSTTPGFTSFYKLFEDINLQSLDVSYGSYVNLKINIMLNGEIHPNIKVVDPEIVSEENFRGFRKTKKHIETILFPINKNIFISGLWISGALQKKITEDTLGNFKIS